MLQQLACSVQAVEVWHANVHDHHIRLQLLGHFDRFAAIGCFTAYFPSFMLLEKRAQTAAYNFVIIG